MFDKRVSAGRWVFSFALLVLPGVAHGQAPITVNSWNLDCGVTDGNLQSQDVLFRAPPIVLPFANSHQAVLGASNAGASYAISLDSSHFDFRTNNTLAAAGNTVVGHTL